MKKKDDNDSVFFVEVVDLRYEDKNEIEEEDESDHQCLSCVRTSFFIINLLLLGLACALLAFGIVGLVTNYGRNTWDVTIIAYASIILCILGGIGLFVFCFGCAPSFINKKCPVITYLCFTSILNLFYMLLLILILLGLFPFQAYIYNQHGNDMLASMGDYSENSDTETTLSWDNIQKMYKCCGVDDYEDWRTYNQNYLPESCCVTDSNGKIPPGCAIIGSQTDGHYSDGCNEKLMKDLRIKAIIVASVLLAAVICMVTNMILGTILCIRLNEVIESDSDEYQEMN